MTDANPLMVGFVGNNTLHSLCPPMMEFLLLRTSLFTLSVEMFKYNYVSGIEHSYISDELSRLTGNVKVYAFCLCP